MCPPTTRMKEPFTKCQSCGVSDLVLRERVYKWQNQGLLADLDDWKQISVIGKRVPSHNYDQGCLERVNHVSDAERD